MTAPPTTVAVSPNPYVGPRAFRAGEQIYGRQQEIAALRDLLIAERIVLLYSPSGAGKSSLIEAGLRAELAARDFLVLPTIRVGLDPTAAVGAAGNRYLVSSLLSLEEGLERIEPLPPPELATIGFAEYLARVTAAGAGDPCLVFDQFEELFTLDPTDQAAKAAFLEEVGVALRNRGLWALFAMREDYIAQLDPYLALLPTRFRTRYRLELLDAGAARLAISRAAADAGVDFQPEAAARLVDDLRRVRVMRGEASTYELGPHVEPVQLQVVCRQLWSSLWP